MVWIKICILYEIANALSGKWILMFQQNDNNIFGVIRGVWGGWGGRTLRKCRRVHVGSSKGSAFLKDPTRVQQHFWRVRAT